MPAVFVVSLPIVFSLFSCSLSYPRRSSLPPRLVFPLEEVSRIDYEGKILGQMEKKESCVYLVTDKNRLYCLDVHEKKVVWSFDSEARLDFSLGMENESLFLLDGEANIACLDKSGQPLWKEEIKEVIPVSLSLGPRLLIVGTDEGFVLGLSPSSGELLWQFKAEKSILAKAAFWESKVICGCLDGKIYILSQNGRLLKAVDIGSPIRTTPLVDEDRMYFGVEDSHFYCFDLRQEKRKWRVLLGGKILAPPVADGKNVFVSASNCVLYCLNKKSGEIQWWRVLPSRSPYELEFVNGQILVSSSSPILLCLDRKTGEQVGSYNAGSEVRSSPAWVEPYVVIHLYDHQAEKGSLVFLRGKDEVKPQESGKKGA